MTIHFPTGTDTASQLARGRQHVTRHIRFRRRAARVAVISGVLLAACTGTAATFAITQASHQTIATGVTCYAHDDLTSFSAGSAMAQADGRPFRAADVPTKREMCGLVWRSGLEQAAGDGGRWPDVDPNASTIPIPALALCTLADGTTGGFPIEAPARTASQVCDRLGLAFLG